MASSAPMPMPMLVPCMWDTDPHRCHSHGCPYSHLPYSHHFMALLDSRPLHPSAIPDVSFAFHPILTPLPLFSPTSTLQFLVSFPLPRIPYLVRFLFSPVATKRLNQMLGTRLVAFDHQIAPMKRGDDSTDWLTYTTEGEGDTIDYLMECVFWTMEVGIRGERDQFDGRTNPYERFELLTNHVTAFSAARRQLPLRVGEFYSLISRGLTYHLPPPPPPSAFIPTPPQPRVSSPDYPPPYVSSSHPSHNHARDTSPRRSRDSGATSTRRRPSPSPPPHKRRRSSPRPDSPLRRPSSRDEDSRRDKPSWRTAKAQTPSSSSKPSSSSSSSSSSTPSTSSSGLIPCMAHFHPFLPCPAHTECPYSHEPYVDCFVKFCHREPVDLRFLPTLTSSFRPVLAAQAPSHAEAPNSYVVLFPLPRIPAVLGRIVGKEGRMVSVLTEQSGIRRKGRTDFHGFDRFRPGDEPLNWVCLSAAGDAEAVDTLMEGLFYCLEMATGRGSPEMAEQAALQVLQHLQEFKKERQTAQLGPDQFLSLISRHAPPLPPLPATPGAPPTASPPEKAAASGSSFAPSSPPSPPPPPPKAAPSPVVRRREEVPLRDGPLDLSRWYEEGLRQSVSSAILLEPFTSTPLCFIRAVAESTFACFPIEAKRKVREMFGLQPLDDAQLISAIEDQFECRAYVPRMEERDKTEVKEAEGGGGSGCGWLQVAVWRKHEEGPAADGRDRRLIEGAVKALLVRYHSVQRRCGLSTSASNSAPSAGRDRAN